MLFNTTVVGLPIRAVPNLYLDSLNVIVNRKALLRHNF